MTKYYLSLLIFTGLSVAGYTHPLSQNGSSSLHGQIIAKSSKAALQYANILLLRADDSTQVNGTVTDETGHFKIYSLPRGEYFLQVNYMGFKSLKSEPFFATDSPVDLGVLIMDDHLIALDQVTVSASKSTFNNTIDKKVYNVGQDISGETGSVSELLQNIPSITVDINGTINLRGSSNVTIFINGKPSLLMRRNSAVALQQIPSNTIEQIEVITNPSAKYTPEGVGGIINIVLKKESRAGTNGSFLVSVGNQDRYNSNLMLNYNFSKLVLYGSYGLRHTNSPYSYTDSRIMRDSSGQISNLYDNWGNARVEPLTHIVNGGLGYSLSESDQLELSVAYFSRDSYHTQTSQTRFRDSLQLITTDFKTDRINDELEQEWELTSNYEHNFVKEDHTLQVEYTFSGYDETEDNHYNEVYSVPHSSLALNHNLIRKGGHQVELVTEYVYPFSDESEFQAGYAGEYMLDDIRYLGEDFRSDTQTWIIDDNKTNRFLFHRDIHAFYTTFGHTMEDISFLAGLRAEQTITNSDLVSSDTTIPNNYFGLFPTLHLAYDLGENQELQLNYSRRINRADSDEHNPFAEYTDPRNMEAGNPRIKPEQIHSLEFGYQLQESHFSILPSIYYRYKYDAFTELHQFVNDSTLLRYYANLDNDQSAGLELIVTGKIRDWMTLNFSSNMFYYQINASNLGYSEKKSTVSWDSKFAATCHLPVGSILQANAYYRSSRLSPQGKTLPRFLVNLGLRQNIFQQRASLSLTVSDVFNSLKWTSRIDTPILYQEQTSKRNSQIIYLGFTWHFGNAAEQESEKFNFEDTI